MKFRLNNKIYFLEIKKYKSNNQNGLFLIDPTSNKIISVIGINVLDEHLYQNEIIIENKNNIHNRLYGAGVVGKIKRYTQNGFNKYPICDLLINP